VYLLDLPARKLFFNAQIKADQSEHNADRPAGTARGLYSERINHVLEDKSRPAHRVDVHLVIHGTQVVHIENTIPKESELTTNSPLPLPARPFSAARMIPLLSRFQSGQYNQAFLKSTSGTIQELFSGAVCESF